MEVRLINFVNRVRSGYLQTGRFNKSPKPIISWAIPLTVFSIIAGIVISYKCGIQKAIESRPQPSTNYSTVDTRPWKTYTNEYYHISLDIPQDWVIKDYLKQDGSPAFELTSAGGEIIIEAPLPEPKQELFQKGIKDSYHVKRDLDKSTVRLGEHILTRIRYTNDFDETMDYISLHNVAYQKAINLFFIINNNYGANNELLLSVLNTFRFTQKETSLDAFVNYAIPNGWKKEQLDPANESEDKVLSFISPDYELGESGGIIRGANIRISRNLADPRKTLKESIAIYLPSNLKKDADKSKSIKIDGRDGLTFFGCWEGCFDLYEIEDAGYWWKITFHCAPSCSTESEMDATNYARNRDAFLNSLVFFGN
jgi:hypothetical protein